MAQHNFFSAYFFMLRLNLAPHVFYFASELILNVKQKVIWQQKIGTMIL